MITLSGFGAARDAGVPDGADRQVRRPRGVQPLRRGLGARHGHAVPVDEAGRVALGRHAQRHDRALAARDQGEGRDPLAVPPRDRRRADDSGSRAAFRSRRSSTASCRRPIEGVSMMYSFNDAKAAERHETQYFEMFGNRGIYHKGWTAVTKHRTPWDPGDGEASVVRRRLLGALRHDEGLVAGARPGEGAAGQAARPAAAVADRSDEVQRPAARRSHDRALQLGYRRVARSSSRATASCSSAAWAGSPRARSSTCTTSRTR